MKRGRRRRWPWLLLIMIVAGGVIPPQDFDAVLAAGAVAIFPPGTVIPEAAEELMERLLAG